MPLKEDIQKLEMDAPIDLYTIDLSPHPFNDSVYRFHPYEKDGVSSNITFDSNVYQQWPIEVTGIDVATGQPEKPELHISNIGGLVAALIESIGDLRGAKVTRVRTLKKYLDGEPAADPTQKFPAAIYIIEQKLNDTPEVLSFTLADPTDLTHRRCGRDVSGINCIHAYRGESCQYAGDPVEEIDETPIAGPFVDRGTWDGVTTYALKDYVSILDEHAVPHVFVSKAGGNLNNRPPNTTWWFADQCIKTLARCKRTPHTTLPSIPYGAEPALRNLPPV